MKQLLTKLFGAPVAPQPQSQLTLLESALLASLKSEPELWHHAEGKTPYGDVFIAMTHRDRGVTVNSRLTSEAYRAWQRDLEFSLDFASEWHPIAKKIAEDRNAKEKQVNAELIAAEMSRRMGLQK